MKAKAKVRNLPPPPPPPTSPSLSSLPDEIIENCLARTSISSYRSLSLVSKNFHSILSSPELYKLRSQVGNTEPCLYICLQSPTYLRWFTLDQTLITKDGEIKNELNIAPINLPSNAYAPPLPSKSTTVSVGSEIYQISKRSSAVHVFDCRSHTWRRAPNMSVARKRTKCVLLDGKIYVIGGGLRNLWGEVFDLKTQTWKPLPSPSEDEILFSDYEVVVFEGKISVITSLKNYAYEYDPKEVKWTKTSKWLFLRRSFTPRPWCVIENLLFYDGCFRSYMCYELSDEKRFRMVKGLEDLYMKRARDYSTIQLVNYGGKVVIIWEEGLGNTKRGQSKRIWCTVIRLEERESHIWGEIEQSNVVLLTVPGSYKFLSCLSVSL